MRQPVQNYQPALHHLTINESKGVDICQDCTDTFIKWQGSIFAKLFFNKSDEKEVRTKIKCYYKEIDALIQQKQKN